MAIKERKQLTGTTTQINAYAGHEGQIVWDKTKKTLVGLSGTAGTNYPLATSEELNTYLPLSGGTMTGDILLNQVVPGARIETTTGEDIGVNLLTDGGMLTLRSASSKVLPGAFSIRARSSAGVEKWLLGESDGQLTWDGQNIPTIFYGTTDLTAGSTDLTTNAIYCVYE